jgi:organic hydroperoxide reductase OsmC/OhrA
MDYKDKPVGKMVENADGSGHFTEVVLNPVVVITEESQIEKANALHDQAHKMCFIANSCNFPILHRPQAIVERS